MMDPQLIAQPQIGPVLDESDVFQCGRCKKQFSSIDVFINHKAECNNSVGQISDVALPSNYCGISHISQNAVVVRKIEIPSSSLTSYPQSLILTEADFLQLAGGLETNSSSQVTSNSTIHISPSHAVVHQPPFEPQNANVEQILQHVSMQESSQPQTFELSFLNDKQISRPVLLTSGQHGNFFLNIMNSPQPQTVICSGSEGVKETVSEACEPVEESRNKEPNTVNIITEFHSSMVKSKKLSETGVEDNQVKRDHKLNCAYCSKTFTKNFDLQQHIRSHTGEKPFQCIVCGRAFAQKSNVKKHMQTHKVWPDGLARTLPPLPPKTSSLSSEDASQDSSSADAYAASQNDEDREKNKSGEINKNSYICPFCKCIFISYFKLKTHLKGHDKEKVYKCILASCGHMFNDLDQFLEHTKSHENEMTYSCRDCNKSFPTLYDLGSHQYTHTVYPNTKTKINKRFYQCDQCMNKYSTHAALDHHLATSSHKYSCTVCEKIFPCERYLRRHLQIHSEIESFVCNICNKTFRTESYLKVHKLCHSEDKPHECEVCKAAFNRKDKLKRHMLIHEAVKKYKCPFRTHCGCPKEFNRPDKLKTHILTHSCIKPYSCKICGRSFTRIGHLREHFKQNHNEEDSKLLDESEKLVKSNPTKSLANCNTEKPHRCRKGAKARKSFNNNVLQKRRKAKSLDTATTKMKTKELLKMMDESSDIDENSRDPDLHCVSDLSDDIPTAHIEIISADGTLVSNSELGNMSLESDINYGILEFENVNEASVHSDSPISVEAIHSSHTDSLLGTELHSAADIADIGDFS